MNHFLIALFVAATLGTTGPARAQSSPEPMPPHLKYVDFERLGDVTDASAILRPAREHVADTLWEAVVGALQAALDTTARYEARREMVWGGAHDLYYGPPDAPAHQRTVDGSPGDGDAYEVPVGTAGNDLRLRLEGTDPGRGTRVRIVEHPDWLAFDAHEAGVVLEGGTPYVSFAFDVLEGAPPGDEAQVVLMVETAGAPPYRHTMTVRADLPETVELFSNHPNPFSRRTVLRYFLPEAAQVEMSVYNVLGQRVARLVDAQQQSGYHVVAMDGTGLGSGTYVTVLDVRREDGTHVRRTQKMVRIP